MLCIGPTCFEMMLDMIKEDKNRVIEFCDHIAKKINETGFEQNEAWAEWKFENCMKKYKN